MIFPGSPPRWLQVCLTRLDAEWQLGSTPLFVLASRKCTHSTFWRSNECVSRAWIKLFCSNLALRQWRRGNMSQLGVDCLNLVQHLQLRCLEDRFLPQKREKRHCLKLSSAHHLSPSGSPHCTCWRAPPPSDYQATRLRCRCDELDGHGQGVQSPPELSNTVSMNLW